MKNLKLGIYILIVLIISGIVFLGLSFFDEDSSNLNIEAEEIYSYDINYDSNEINNLDKVTASNVYVYGETLNIDFNDAEDYDLFVVDTNTKEVVDEYQIKKQIDVGVFLEHLPVGSFFFKTSDESYIEYDNIKLELNTITRDNYSNKIEIDIVDGLLHVVKYEETASNGEVDILIDPGHGGIDTGAVAYDESIYESELNLIVAEKLAEKLTELGYNVALTRTDDTRPGDCEEAVSAYCPLGRVTQAYTTNAKLVISLHHNTGGATGFEVYSSYYSSHILANIVAEKLSEVSEYSTKSYGYVSDGIYVETYEDDEGLNTPQDAMYMIRETGGIATKSVNDKNKPNNLLEKGAESILIEFGYMDDYYDLLHITNDDVIEDEVESLANAINDYINLNLSVFEADKETDKSAES